MKPIIVGLSVILLSACSSFQMQESESTIVLPETNCEGSTALPAPLSESFVAIEDDALLQSALGEPNKGKLCQGQVYQSKANAQVTVYRAWNSTNPNSQFGQWWAFNVPSGKIAQYRSDFEICYQWSPLDKMVTCELKAGSKVVVGNGQSAQCSDYLTYPVSSAQQVYMLDAKNAMENCKEFDGVMSWQAIQ